MPFPKRKQKDPEEGKANWSKLLLSSDFPHFK
jgi:hypothetical protein